MKPSSVSAAAPLLPLDLWLPGQEILRGAPAALVPWLTDPGLLTDRVREAAGAAVQVRVVEERLGFLSAEQRALLAAAADSCFVRRVELVAAGRPWVFAESLVPDHTLELHPWLAELGDSSLGTTLAGLAGIRRGAFEYAPLPAVHPLAAAALARRPGAGVVWARRSWFELSGRRLLVQEVFLTGDGA
ncbi:MAG: chorismate lyase [Proteobacteria bacterium]|nr:chorismate lyase [Pseudomonadota bacterium]